MKKAAISFLKGLWSVPHGWKVWLLVLLLANGIGPLFFFPELTAVVTLVCFVTGLVIAVYLTELYGYGKILSLMHGPWIPLVLVNILLHPGFGRVAKMSHPDGYIEWLTASIVVSLISLVLDFYDLAIYRSQVLKKRR